MWLLFASGSAEIRRKIQGPISDDYLGQAFHEQSIKMSIPRLSFLYPHIFKPARLCEPALAQRPLRAAQKQCFSTTRRRAEETYAQRYGSAAEPLPHPLVPNDLGRSRALESIEKEVVPPAPQQEVDKAGQPKEAEKAATQHDQTSSEQESDPQENPSPPSELDANEAKAQELVDSPRREAISKPLDRVLQIETPTETKTDEEQKPPHLEAPRYVHHFDTFTLVRDLAKGGFTEAQSVTLMKAVRSLLGVNMEVAHAGLISKSDVENVPSPPPPLPPAHATNPPSRKTTSSEPPAPNSAPKFSTPANPPQQK